MLIKITIKIIRSIDGHKKRVSEANFYPPHTKQNKTRTEKINQLIIHSISLSLVFFCCCLIIIIKKFKHQSVEDINLFHFA